MEEVRLLTKDDIDVRVAQVNAYTDERTGESTVTASLLLYKDARVDMKILDELFGPMGWKRSHKMMDGRLYCCVEVYDAATNQWIGKEDVGTESYTEAEKGQASDSFKRACFNWGIGRELYTAPRISLTLAPHQYYRDKSGKIRVKTSFLVKSIGYGKDRTVNALVITDKYGKVVYTLGEYRPMDAATYERVIANYAQGKTTKNGGCFRETWADMTNAGPKELTQFDKDVVAWCVRNQRQMAMTAFHEI